MIDPILIEETSIMKRSFRVNFSGVMARFLRESYNFWDVAWHKYQGESRIGAPAVILFFKGQHDVVVNGMKYPMRDGECLFAFIDEREDLVVAGSQRCYFGLIPLRLNDDSMKLSPMSADVMEKAFTLVGAIKDKNIYVPYVRSLCALDKYVLATITSMGYYIMPFVKKVSDKTNISRILTLDTDFITNNSGKDVIGFSYYSLAIPESDKVHTIPTTSGVRKAVAEKVDNVPVEEKISE